MRMRCRNVTFASRDDAYRFAEREWGEVTFVAGDSEPWWVVQEWEEE